MIMTILVLVFLNGVCRHERSISLKSHKTSFLNGVCRHELQA
ncbi:hypothetical protein URS_2221 [Acinetobacter ursingii]|nr:hypothetical protein URS_2221 [Acinetobacter ursingii]